MRLTRNLAALAALAAAGTALASPHLWQWELGDPGSYGINNDAGNFKSMSCFYDDATNQFNYEVRFSNQVTNGFTLAVSPGDNPKGHAGELALFYFDAKDMNNPVLSTYAYNGENTQRSYKDGSPDAGDQTPDRILSTTGAFAFPPFYLFAADIGSERVFRFGLDASDIMAHDPIYGPDGDWTGVSFGEHFGIWMHPVRELATSYNDDGFLTNWNGRQGWFDGSGFNTSVPAPSAAALAAVAGLMASRRRRA